MAEEKTKKYLYNHDPLYGWNDEDLYDECVFRKFEQEGDSKATQIKEKFFRTKYPTWNHIPKEIKNKTIESITELFYDCEIYDLRDNMKYSDIKNNSFICIGTVGLWNGNKKAGGVYDNINELIKSITYGDKFDIYVENDKSYYVNSHHDGTNSFEIKMLTDEGIELRKSDGFDRYNIDHIVELNDDKYAKSIDLFKLIFG